MMGFKDNFARIITFMASMFQRMKNFLAPIYIKAFAPSSPILGNLQLTTGIGLFLCFTIVASVQYFGQPINCMTKAGDAEASQLTEDHCWNSRIFRFPPDSKFIKGKDYWAYYRWAPTILLAQGTIFLLVSVFCKSSRWLPAPSTCSKMFKKHRSSRKRDTVTKTHIFILACHVFIWVNAMVNLLFVDWFLGNPFLTYGPEIVMLPYMDQSRRNDTILTIFPRVIRCSMNDTDVCNLPINVLNEKIFIGLCIWFLALADIIFLHICIDLYRLLVPTDHQQRPVRYATMKRRIKQVKDDMIEFDISPGDQIYLRYPDNPPKDTLQVVPDKKGLPTKGSLQVVPDSGGLSPEESPLIVLGNEENGKNGYVLLPVAEDLL